MLLCRFLKVVLCSIVISSAMYAMDNRKRVCPPPTPRKIRPAKRIKIIANLFDAAKEGDIVLVKKFIQDGANVNMVVDEGPDKGKTPLVIAVKMGHKEVVEILLKADADISYKIIIGIDQGTNAVYWAYTRKNNAIICLLIRHLAQKELNVMSKLV